MILFPIGWIIIPLSIFFFVYFPKRLLYLTVFFIPFTGTSVFKISLSGIDADGIRVSMFLGTLCLLQFILTNLKKFRKVNEKIKSTTFILILISLSVTISAFMPAIINGSLKVLDPYGEGLVYYAKEVPLTFRFQYITQYLFFLFGLLFSLYLNKITVGKDLLTNVIKIYLISSIFVSFWGWFEYFCFFTGIKYPGFLFNQNSVNFSSILLDDNGFPRITSVALEPSIMSQQLLTALPFLFWAFYFKEKILSRVFDFIGVLSISLVLVFSLSTTAYVGLALMFLFAIIILFREGKIKRWFVFLLFTIITGIGFVSPVLVENVLLKLGSYSGIERFKSLEYGWKYFLEYPIFGIGWGVFPSWDLITCTLAGGGLITFFLFVLLFTKNLFKQSKIVKKVGDYSNSNFSRPILTGIFQSTIMLLIVSQISGFTYYAMYFWFILAISISMNQLNLISKNKING
ncbi:O-antigen ligase family protein [Flexithrix dorotheae]|uniref:O-antigen ligase family protein n=1 Tax=Flexithrix dorotheae TaxID=70993 RepID=UPI00036F482B|nr:O-antigen ligase family protein [Flexithrix dorotheae]